MSIFGERKMKKSVILDIFNGRRGHFEQFGKTDGDEKNAAALSDAYDELKAKVSPEQFAVFEKFENAIHKDSIEEVDFYYKEGFKLGLQLGIECMENN